MLFFDFIEICSGNCDGFMLQILKKITYWMVPYMPVCRKMQNIAFSEKVHNFQMVIIVSKSSKIDANWLQPNVERFEIYSANSFHFSGH